MIHLQELGFVSNVLSLCQLFPCLHGGGVFSVELMNALRPFGVRWWLVSLAVVLEEANLLKLSQNCSVPVYEEYWWIWVPDQHGFYDHSRKKEKQKKQKGIRLRFVDKILDIWYSGIFLTDVWIRCFFHFAKYHRYYTLEVSSQEE